MAPLSSTTGGIPPQGADATRKPAGHRLDPLLAPRSIALLGASTNPGSFGSALLEMAVGGGFAGDIYPVNPKYREAGGLPVYPTLSALPAVADHVVLSVANERLEAGLLDAARHGAKAVTIFATGHGGSADGDGLGHRIRAIARDTGLLVCGPNSMGFHNLDIGLRISPFPAPTGLVPGGIAAILQSGSVMGALAHNDQRLRFSLLVSTGSEAAVSAADYLDWLLDRPTTRVVGLFLETVRDPAAFLAALRRADLRRIPVVVLKVGRTDASKRMAQSHTGAIVGDHGVFEAVARDHGVHLVDTFDEMAATLQLFAMGRPAAPGGLASIHDSGGERELLADLASDFGLGFAELGEATATRIAGWLEPGLKAENPLDAWGSGRQAEATFRNAAEAIMADDAVAAGFYVLDWRENYYLHEMHERVLTGVAADTAKPLVAVSNYSLTVDREMARRMADRGVPLIKGTREALVAARHLLAHRDRRPVRHGADGEHPDAGRLRAAMASRDFLDEAFGYSLLAAYGIPVPAHASADGRDAAVAAARALGFPVALKTAAPGILHKTELRGVALNLADAAAVGTAYDDIAGRLGREVLVCAMAAGEAEWAVGILNDRDFGPAVMIAPGGIMVELLDERAILMAPFAAADAEAALRELRATRLLTGFRGRPRLALERLCGVAAALSRIAADFREQIAEMDINPVLLSGEDAVAVDVMIRRRD